MDKYTYIIDEVVKPEKTRAIVRKMIPQLIRWAQNGQTDKTYRDMIHILNYERWSGIGRALGYVEDVMQALRNESKKQDIPSLNALCRNAHTKLPSAGFSYVHKDYDTMSDEAKKIFVDGINLRAVNYKEWDWVLGALGLQPVLGLSKDEWKEISKPVLGKGGEGKEHKALKEYVKSNPHVIGIKDVEIAETEYLLPSGDRLDVYFVLKDGTHIAVEVKPKTSPDSDVSRGIFQCVKYEATMKAVRLLESRGYSIQTYLVLGSEISSLNKMIADELGVKYIDCLKEITSTHKLM